MRTITHITSCLLAGLLFLTLAPLASAQDHHSGDATAITSTRSGNFNDPVVWGGTTPSQHTNLLIQPGHTITIPAGQHSAKNITIQAGARLLVNPTANSSLSVENLFIFGDFQAGTATAPVTGQFTLTLVGSNPDLNFNQMGTKSIQVHSGGTLDVHGTPRSHSWTKLATTAAKDSNTISLLVTPNWKVGDKIAISSTDFDYLQAEERTIAAISGSTITLDHPLLHTHYGQTQTYGGKAIDTRAEVALLSKNVVIKGDASSQTSGFGGHTMGMKGATMRISWAELVHMGQKLGKQGINGRYPIHFHMAGDVSGSYVKGVSIHHAFNRGITLHGVDRWLLTDNVIYDTVGHAYFFEDAVERFNVLERNLGFVIRRPEEALIPSDKLNDFGPAVFWVTNPNNILRGNVAAGSQGSGIWYDLHDKPTGLSADVPINPQRDTFGVFENNTAHSNGSFGIFMDAYIPPVEARAIVDSPTAYKNRRDGMWLTTQTPANGAGEFYVRNARMADNLTGMIAPGFVVVEDSLYVGESANLGNPKQGEPVSPQGNTLPLPQKPAEKILGHKVYAGPNLVRNSVFANFITSSTRPAGAVGFREDLVTGPPPWNVFRGLTLINSNAAYIHGDSKNKSLIARDVDGTLTGSANSTLSSEYPSIYLTNAASSVYKPEWQGYLNTHGVAQFRSACIGGDCPHSFMRQSDGNAFTAFYDDGHLNIAMNQTYYFSRNSTACSHEFSMNYYKAGDYVHLIWQNYQCQNLTVSSVKSGQTITPVTSKEALLLTSTSSYFHDPVSKDLHLMMRFPTTQDFDNPIVSQTDWLAIRVNGSGSTPVMPLPTNPASPNPSPAPSICSADINTDGIVDLSDFSILSSNFFKAILSNPRADINKDGIVDLSDFSILRTQFGKQSCP